MLKLQYVHSDFEGLLTNYADFFGVRAHAYELDVPPSYGKGYLSVHHMPNGLEIFEMDCTIQEPIFVQRKPSSADAYVLRFDVFETPGLSLSDKPIIRSAAHLANTATEWIFMLPSQTRIRSYSLHFSHQWLEQWIYRDEENEVIRQYLLSGNTAHHLEALDTDYLKLIDLVFGKNGNPSLQKLQLFNATNQLLHRFFSRLYQRIEVTNFDSRISAFDRSMLKEVEQKLLSDFSEIPPGIRELARTAAMSPSKLKAIFKYVYGLPIYQYYQKHRMNKAKAMLISKRYTVKEVSRELGFEQPTNFIKAYKKAFDQNPASLTGESANERVLLPTA